MAKLDWSKCPGVESSRGGAAVFRNSRTPVSAVLDNLDLGASIDDIMDWYGLAREQVVAVLEFAGRSAEVPPADS